jgi:acyl-CoA reductase-like NAD-dependent aldehyde dehydrogenase
MATLLNPSVADPDAGEAIAVFNPATGKQIGEVPGGGRRLDRPGYFVEPTVLAGVTPDMRLFREEIFGPSSPSSSSTTKMRWLRSPTTPNMALPPRSGPAT